MDLKLQCKSKAIYAFLMALFSVWGWGQNTGTMTITRNSFSTGNLSYGFDDQWTTTTSQNDTVRGFFDIFSQGAQTTMQTNAGSSSIASMPYNSIAVPGPITKITLVGGGTGTARAWNPYLSTTALLKSNFTT